jgi:hypothetical protein
MEESAASVTKVTSPMAEISVASKEQSAALGQISDAVVHMDGVTQQNAALVVNAAESAHSLREQSLQLTQAMSIFKVADITSVRCNALAAPPHATDKEPLIVNAVAPRETLKLVSNMA